MSRVRVQAVGPANHLEPTVETSDPKWPIKLVLAPKNNDASRRFTLHIEARDSQDQRLMTLRFASGFVAKHTRYVKLIIHEACVKAAASCAAGETCNVWSFDVSEDDLGRKADDPHEVDATCAAEDMTPITAGSGGTAGMTPAETAGSAPQAGADAGTGGSGGSNQGGAGGQTGACGTGYVRRLGSCVDIDECALSNPCGDHGTCQNSAGDYECQCDPGYTHSQTGACVAPEECQTNNGGCSSVCDDSSGVVVCSCGKDEWLKADGKSCGKFGPPKRVSMGGSMQPMEPRFAFDPDGNGLAVWRQSDAMSASIWMRRFAAGSGWSGMPSKLMITAGGTPSAPRVALAANGHGQIVWLQTEDNDGDVWSMPVTAQALGAGARIDQASTGSAINPALALDADGNGFAIWTQSDGSSYSEVWWNQLVAAKGWQKPQALEPSGNGQAYGADLSLDAHGNAALIWTQATFTDMSSPRFSPWTSHFETSSEKFHSPTELDDTGSAGGGSCLQLFGDGDAIAVWPRLSNGSISMHASRYSASSDWDDSIDIGMQEAEFSSVVPSIALSSLGIGAAIWTQHASPAIQIWANRYEGASDQWSGAMQLSAVQTTTEPAPRIAVDPSGSGFGVWSEVSGASRIIRAWRLQAHEGFAGGLNLTEDMTAQPAMNSQVQIAVDAQGNAVAIWDSFEMGQYSVWASTFE